MRLTDILQPQCIKVPLAAATKRQVIDELIDLLADQGAIVNRDEMKTAVWAREQTRTTGIGHGVAIPHGKTAGCPKLALAIGKPAQPIDFNSVDGNPVDLIFLLASPLDQTGPHIQALAGISRMLTDPDFRRQIKIAGSAPEVYQLICDHSAAVAT
jgi:fructose-specific phosphotransferase system IIA component